MRIRSVLATVSVAVLTSCGGDGPTTLTPVVGVTFTFAGAGGGTFSAAGELPGSGSGLADRDWAVGFRDAQNAGYAIQALHARGGGRYDAVILFITRTTVGSTTIAVGCNPQTEVCDMVYFGVNLSEADNNFNFICMLTSGSIAIGGTTDTRIRGTFSGAGVCGTPSGGSGTISISNGTFDVPLVTTTPF